MFYFMKTYYNLLAIAIAILSCTFISCKNDSANTPDQPKRHISRPDSVYMYDIAQDDTESLEAIFSYQYNTNGQQTLILEDRFLPQRHNAQQTIMRYDERGNLIEEFGKLYNVEEDKWYFSSVREVYSYDENGKMTEKFRYDRFLPDSTWQVHIKVSYLWPEDNHSVGTVYTYYYQEEKWILSGRNETFYNTDGNITHYESYQYSHYASNDSIVVINPLVEDYIYDMYGNLILQQQRQKVNDNPYYEERNEYTYDASGNILSQMNYHIYPGNNNSVSFRYKYVYYY